MNGSQSAGQTSAVGAALMPSGIVSSASRAHSAGCVMNSGCRQSRYATPRVDAAGFTHAAPRAARATASGDAVRRDLASAERQSRSSWYRAGTGAPVRNSSLAHAAAMPAEPQLGATRQSLNFHMPA